uniref:Uncharacterized protein n=1 Tax=Calidris pygmaea TaxID=425635 RepID=A0A8C3JD73_9CHAR
AATPLRSAAPNTPPARSRPTVLPPVLRCPRGRRGSLWMALTPKLWGSRTGEPRSWPTRCWPGASPCPTTSRWPCRASDPCLGCSSRCRHYLPLPSPGLDQCKDQYKGLDRDRHLQTITDLTEGLTCPLPDPQEFPQECLGNPPAAPPSPGRKVRPRGLVATKTCLQPSRGATSSLGAGR